ncbi:MAG: DUF1517 domain-containing protein [Symploca sp. SIO1A3]|nr:DUF1517 domain-containing protein [Symploca sp. SIO1A3]
MSKKIFAAIKPLLKSLVVFGLILTLVLGNASSALAARSGGRIGGGSFRVPSRSYSVPNGGYRAPVGGGYYAPGGGFGFPFLLPFFGFGGGFGSLFSILIFLAIANFLVKSIRSASNGGEISSYNNPKVSVARVQVGLLANARELQPELNELVLTADTGSAAGRAQVLQESTLALLRHPEYWVYGGSQSQQTNLEAAEAKFNQLALTERSKFTKETLSNFNARLTEGSGTTETLASDKDGELLKTETAGEYIVVTIVVGATGKLALPTINNSDELNQALQMIGGLSSERLLAMEILWTPQAEGDTLTADDLMAGYPDLKLV